MQNKLQELTQKIYTEGVAKGNEEAERIISSAKAEAENIIKEAQDKAALLIRDANKKVTELNENTLSELKLASKQVINTVKQNITSIINDKIISRTIRETTSDKAFIKQLIEKIISKWNPGDPSSSDLTIILPASEREALEDYFKQEAKNLLNKGITIQYSNGLKSGFQIAPKDGSYKISFSEEEFENYFKEFMRPKLVELLFGE